MSPRSVALVALLTLCVSACAKSSEPVESAVAADKSDASSLGVNRFQKTFAAGEVTLDALDVRREALDTTYFKSSARSPEFDACIGEAGNQDAVMARCEYAEAERLDLQMNALLQSVAKTELSSPPEEQSAWEQATKEGCAWSPSEEGTSGQLNAAACVTNRLASRVEELRVRTGSEAVND